MLELQRASAGSGKTFALAKKFIWYYITIPDRGGRRLRTPAELSDSLEHILAVTFTNKATNEMQQRIVEKLFQLGYPPANGKRPDYMDDFLRDLNAGVGNLLEEDGASGGEKSEGKVTEEKISETCRRAVELLLNNYSDFNVSTIDSFFQMVLRTFAYESDLGDSYRIEIDSDALSAMSIDALLEAVNAGTDRTGAAFWLAELMNRAKEAGSRWNIFAKGGTYADLAKSVNRLENEEYKIVRRPLDRYFKNNPDFSALYQEMRDTYEDKPRTEYQRLRMAVQNALSTLRRVGDRLDPTDQKAFRLRIKKGFGWKPLMLPTAKEDILTERKTGPTYEKRRASGDVEAYSQMEEADERMAQAYDQWTAALSTPEFRHWKVYRENLPFLGLLQALNEKREEYLRDINAIELGETNSMLHEIIGEDDAPFIYERLGTRFNHFLIDEFQDTSKMQWRNMSPLLHESIGRGNENLIIGDAKQSIYRFRNADSSLISQRVPEEFGLPDEGESFNTNWRSDLRVVQFNNNFFHFLVRELNRLVGSDLAPERRDFLADYLNVVQHPHNKKDNGYVEVKVHSMTSKQVIDELPDLIERILARGFRMRDIVVLTQKNDQSENIIECFTKYNASLDNSAQEGILGEKQAADTGRHHLEFVSELSLKLTSSPAVNMVVAVLETILNGADPEVREGKERKKKGVGDWDELKGNFRFFMLRHPDMNPVEALNEFLASGGDNNAIGDMLARMQSVSLPALVESVAAEFLPGEWRQRDAVFLAAFQDLVLEYCEGHPSDLASFLDWWVVKKEKASISSPEDMDAITVMTVHKSKGLEFPVVIVPFMDDTFKDKESSRKKEWRWVRPEVVRSEIGELPPFIPVAIDSNVAETAHRSLLYEYHDLRKMDVLNAAYVAFTRAAKELYIFSKGGTAKSASSDGVSFGSLFREFFGRIREKGENVEIGEEDKWDMMDPAFVDQPEDETYTYGVPYHNFQGKVKVSGEDRIMDEYTAHPTPDFLTYRMEDAPDVIDADDPELEEDQDPRSEGNLLHAIMEQVGRQQEIPRAVRRLVIAGKLTPEYGSELGAFLTVKTALPEVEHWFDGSFKVITERPIIKRGERLRRPDRVMVNRAGDAIVVDYKFGESLKTEKKYLRQVKGYVESLKQTGKYRSVRGYLWYVKLDNVVEVK